VARERRDGRPKLGATIENALRVKEEEIDATVGESREIRAPVPLLQFDALARPG
jgi:hypothetical protein